MQLDARHYLVGFVLGLVGLSIVSFAGVPHRVGPTDYYPPSVITGVINPDVTQATIQLTICKSGWTATIRPSVSYTNALKTKQEQEFNLSCPQGCEEDHYISLELGGSPTDPTNLWPEAYPAAKLKDQAENALKRAVCSNQMTLKQAQDTITGDWYVFFQKHLQGTFGSVGAEDEDDTYSQ